MSDAVHKAALDLLSRREHSRRELARKLRRRGHARADIDEVLARLEAVGLVSDERYARLFVRDRLTVNPQGSRRLLTGLRTKGIVDSIAELAVLNGFEERGLGEPELAREVAVRRLPRLRGLDAVAARRRLSGYLARRGFAASTVASVVRELIDAGRPGSEASALPADG
ncbi:MAG: regulatory protein RecX [Gemmatimonadetes bacterium]|nr:regulatory protein RecX [Gemmatimonadota bacterium]